MNPEKNLGKILIVDDTPYNLKVLSNILIQKGHQVSQALNGEIALMAAESNPPDVILLDIMMQGMDGYEVCKRLKASEKTANIPVIFLTALDDLDYKLKAWSYGGVDYITKPFHFSEALVRIENQIRIRLTQKKLEEKNQEIEQINQELTQINQALIKKNYEIISWLDHWVQDFKQHWQLIRKTLKELPPEYLAMISAKHQEDENQIYQVKQEMEERINYLVDYCHSLAPFCSSELPSIDGELWLPEQIKE